jgi:hypothetical protein
MSCTYKIDLPIVLYYYYILLVTYFSSFFFPTMPIYEAKSLSRKNYFAIAPKKLFDED